MNLRCAARAFLAILACLAAGLGLPSCSTAPPPELAARNAAIAAEPTGDFFIGRRYHVVGTRFWGWVREPGKPWSTSRLVMMNESVVRTPDRLPEDGAEGSRIHGYDNNFEYRITGRFTNRGVYDPNSDLTLPEFVPTSFTVINENPGFVFNPREKYKPTAITIYPPGGIRQQL